MSESNEPKIYLRRPSTVEAVKFDGDAEAQLAVLNWIVGMGGNADANWSLGGLDLLTDTGMVNVQPGEVYILRGERGNFYPAPASEFDLLYYLPEGATSDS